jgi:hypothetical protein
MIVNSYGGQTHTMRDDMKTVLTERPRTKSWAERRKTGRKIRPVDLDDDLDIADEQSRLPSSRLRVYGHDHKSFTDHIMPLRRYLRAQVGRSWDDVWSELCTTLDRRSTTGNHVFEHIRWEVETNTVLIDGTVYEYLDGSGTPAKVYGLYVHPVTRILSWAPERRYSYTPKKDTSKIQLAPNRYLTRIDGIWYEGIYERHETMPISTMLARAGFGTPRPYRVIEATETATGDDKCSIGNRTYYFPRRDRTVYWVRRSKRQLSTKELRDHGLQNCPENAR